VTLTPRECGVLANLDDVWRTLAEIPHHPTGGRGSLTAVLVQLRRRGLVAYRRQRTGGGAPRGEWAITAAGDRAVREYR
jgi:DNA-binding PadR family transcriptional regulator